jgi:hypothetical protein
MKRNKSKATRKRDRKRHEQYIEQKKVTENNKETEIKETNTNNIEYSSSEDRPDPQRRVKRKHTRQNAFKLQFL